MQDTRGLSGPHTSAVQTQHPFSLLNYKGILVPVLSANNAEANSATKSFSCFYFDTAVQGETIYLTALAIPCPAIILEALPSLRC